MKLLTQLVLKILKEHLPELLTPFLKTLDPTKQYLFVAPTEGVANDMAEALRELDLTKGPVIVIMTAQKLTVIEIEKGKKDAP